MFAHKLIVLEFFSAILYDKLEIMLANLMGLLMWFRHSKIFYLLVLSLSINLSNIDTSIYTSMNI